MRLSELAEFDYVIIESSGISEPEQVAETFDVRLAEQISAVGEGPEGLDESTVAMLRRLKDAGGLEKFARLDTTCTVIDAFTMFHDFETVDLISARRDDVTPEDERTVSDLMVDQIEFADVIVLNKIDAVDASSRDSVRSLIKKLNHRAKIVECNYGKVPVAEIVNTGMFNIELAQTGYGWLQDLHAMTVREVNGRKTVTPKPETEEYVSHIANLAKYTADRSSDITSRTSYTFAVDPSTLKGCSSSSMTNSSSSIPKSKKKTKTWKTKNSTRQSRIPTWKTSKTLNLRAQQILTQTKTPTLLPTGIKAPVYETQHRALPVHPQAKTIHPTKATSTWKSQTLQSSSLTRKRTP
jgi:G3E family GTPase